jgi:hypothetical protein
MTKGKSRVTVATEEVRDRVGPAAESTKDAVGSALVEAKSRVAPVLGDAKDKVGPALSDAKDKVGPVLSDAKDKVAPVLGDARDKLAPVAQQALQAGVSRGQTAAVKLRLMEEPKPSHKVRNLLAIIGLVAVVAFVAKRFAGRRDDWSDAKVTPPGGEPARSTAPEPAAASTPNGHVAAAPSAPLVSEETVSSSTPTTPDAPLEEKKVGQD